MNTSKSLDDILDTADWTKVTPSGYLDGKALERKAAAKQAIVEAVEGLIGEDLDYRGNSPEVMVNEYKASLRKAIKEWQ